MSDKIKIYHYKLTTLSPVHIGTQDAYNPTNFVFIEDKEKAQSEVFCPECKRFTQPTEDRTYGKCDAPLYEEQNAQQPEPKYDMYIFSPEILRQISGWENELTNAIKSDDLSKINSFFYKKVSSKIAETKNFKGAFKKAAVSKDAYNTYKEAAEAASKGKKGAKQLNIDKQFCDVLTNKPVIPGSSIKGSLRTAFLDQYFKSIGNNSEKTLNEQELKKRLNEKEKNVDPCFQKLKISDANLSNDVNTRIVMPENYERKSQNRKAQMGMLEVIPQGAVFEGDITVCEDNSLLTQVKEKANAFFKERMEQEKKYAGRKCVSFYENLEPLSSDSVLLRVGAHSGAECVTVSTRRIYIPQQKTCKNEATTFWLCEGMPFGWVKMEIKDENNEIKIALNQT